MMTVLCIHYLLTVCDSCNSIFSVEMCIITSIFLSLLDEMKWRLIIVIVVAVIFCLIGVVLWITVGAVVTNPPDGSKCTTSFPFQSSFPFLPHLMGREGRDVAKTTPTHV